MRRLAFTDIHGTFDPVVRAMESESDFDAIVLGGDLTTYGTPEDVRQYLRSLPSNGKPVMVVAGNMDPPELDQEFLRLGVSINAKGRLVGSVGFFGVSAAPLSPLHTPYEIPEEEIAARAESGWNDVRHSGLTVFVPHAPPRNTTLDRTFLGHHVGSTAVRAFIEKQQPDVTVCGHIHESRGVESLGKTLMVNCGPAGKGKYALITLDKEIDIQLRG